MNYFQNALKIFIVFFLASVSNGSNMVCAKDRLQQQFQNLQIITEEYPPVSFTDKDGKADGLAVEVVKEIMKRLNMKQKIKVWPWARGYKKTAKGPNFVLFSTTRTKERESLFYWVGPIFEMRSGFYAKKGSEIKIKRLDEAKKLKAIGTYRECFDEQFLKKQGFKNLESVTDNVLNMKKLMGGRFKVVTATNITIQSILKDAGYTIDDVEELFTFLTVRNYVAFSKQVPIEVVNAWQQAFEDIKNEGSLTKIHKKWLP